MPLPNSSGVGLALAGATELVTLLFLARTHSLSLYSGCAECGVCIVRANGWKMAFRVGI